MGRKSYKKEVTLSNNGSSFKKEVEFFGWEKLDAVDMIKDSFKL
jgi:S-adenosylmethionine synthetase